MDQSTRENFKKMFFWASVWNWYFGALGLFLPKLSDKIVFGLKTVLPFGFSTFFRQITWGIVLIFGFGYYWISLDPEKNRSTIWLGILGKLLFFFTGVQYFSKKVITFVAFLVLFGDFVFTLLFSAYIVKSKDEAKGAVPKAA